ncbi:MAG: hypothetical protein MUF42_15710 [Cytophagaceae bacterium]|nr:hypothetical protein [Cytophagaceae bacterium]
MKTILEYYKKFGEHPISLIYLTLGTGFIFLFVYAGLSGWIFFSSPTENWSPDGHTTHRSRSTHHSYHRYHK